MKKILGVYSAPGQHWVGDGFPVRSLFSYDSLGQQLSPFLLLDYGGPTTFEPTPRRRGVGQHPHRGFETVTIVYEGEVEHRDSSGGGGKIGPGDVQWMTAASGILHEEYHSEAFGRTGGAFEMVQLWVNLPARDKMAPAGYQTLLDAEIPAVDLPGGAGKLRVIAGDHDARHGPARTFTPIDVWDVRLNAGHTAGFDIAEGRTLAAIVLKGTALVNGQEVVRDAQMVVFDREAGRIEIEANSDVKLLILSGEPIDEPIVGYGPFVMTSEDEIRQAITDFNKGDFGRIAH